MNRFQIRPSKLLAIAGMVAILSGSLALAARDDDRKNRGWLGVFLDGNSDQDGIKIVSVIEDSPAEMAGFQKGDVIVRVNGVEIEDPQLFFSEFSGLNPGDRVEIIVNRDNDQEEIVVVLGENSGRALRIPHIRKQIRLGYNNPEMRNRGYLGVHLQDLTNDLREYFGVPEGEGVLVAKVEEDSPADLVGIKAGDVITEANGETIDNSGSLLKALRGVEEGDSIDVTYYRDGRVESANVIAGSTESHVYEVSPFIWCDKEEGECSGSGNFDFDFDFDSHDWHGSLEKLQEYFGGEDFQDRIRAYTLQYQDVERQLEKKMDMLERKLREMERRLEGMREDEGDASRKLSRPAKPRRLARV